MWQTSQWHVDMLSRNRRVICKEMKNNHMLPSDKVRKQWRNCNLEIQNNGHGKSSADLIPSRWALELIRRNNVNLVLSLCSVAVRKWSVRNALGRGREQNGECQDNTVVHVHPKDCMHFWSCHLQRDLAERKGLGEEQQERLESASTQKVGLRPG